jgi:hypothetical protein
MKAIWDRPEDKALTLRSRIRRGLDQGSLPAIKEHGQTFRRNEIAKTLSASARICIARAHLIDLYQISRAAWVRTLPMLEEPANLEAAIGANDVRYASHGRVQNLNANLISLSCAIATFRPDVVVLRDQPKGL